MNQLINFLQGKLNKPSAQEVDEEILRHVTYKSANIAQQNTQKSGYVIVEGVGNLMHHIARCCQPIPGDEIVGYVTQGRGISIHRSDCEQFNELQQAHPERVVESVWGESFDGGFRLSIRITANDRSGLLRDITTILANEKISVLGVNTRLDNKKQLAMMDLEISLNNVQILSKILTRLAALDDVIEAKRL